jgi:hypothetical protein
VRAVHEIANSRGTYYRAETTAGNRQHKQRGDCFAKANISAAETAARQDTRISRAHEDRRRPQGFGGAPQEGTPSAHARVSRRVCSFPAKRGLCGGENLTLCIARANAARIPTSLFSFARTNCRKAASGSASRRRWAVRWYAIASGGACERLCAVIARRYPQDGTLSFTRRSRSSGRNLPH